MALTKEAAARKDRTMPSGRLVMQHRHFAVIAEIIRELPHDRNARLGVARAFANRLRATNPKFNEDRFMSACMDEEN